MGAVRGRVRLLTPFERRVLEEVAQGNGLVEVARGLGMRPATVRVHIGSIERKLGFHSMLELAAWAWWSGWLRRDPTNALVRARGR